MRIDRKFDFAGDQKKKEEVIRCQAPDAQPFRFFKSARPDPASSSFLIYPKNNISVSKKQVKFLKSL